MRKLWVILAVVGVLVAGCGAKTKSELKAESKLHEEYTVNKNYQEVYRGIADKFVECMGSSAQYLHRNIYSELGNGEFYFNGADAAGYAFLVEVERIDGGHTNIKVYSKLSAELMKIARMGSLGQDGCPK